MAADPYREQPGLDMTAPPLRRPGSTARLKPHGSNESIDSHNSVAITPNEPPPSNILAEMERFAAEVESSDAQPMLPNGHIKLKYKPKSPPLRYKDRHPDTVTIEVDTEMMDVDSDDGDFVYDTYVREPDTAVSIDEMNGNIGILVITEEDQEVWESYIDEDDSDKDWNSEEEDENGTIPDLCFGMVEADSCSGGLLRRRLPRGRSRFGRRARRWRL